MLLRLEITKVFFDVVVAFSFFTTKTMPVLQSQDFIDFSNATLDEKIDVVFELLEKQRDLARLMSENVELPLEVRTLCMFIVVIAIRTSPLRWLTLLKTNFTRMLNF